MIIHEPCFPLTQAEAQPISLWPAESNALAGLVMKASSEIPTYGVKRVDGCFIWSDSADQK